MVYNASTFKRKRKTKEKQKKNDLKLKGRQVVLYEDQQGHVKQKFNDLSSN